MTIFVFFMNLLVAAFILTFITEISSLLIGSLGIALEYRKGGKGNGT